MNLVPQSQDIKWLNRLENKAQPRATSRRLISALETRAENEEIENESQRKQRFYPLNCAANCNCTRKFVLNTC